MTRGKRYNKYFDVVRVNIRRINSRVSKRTAVRTIELAGVDVSESGLEILNVK
jgi:hypothetical protein